MRESTKCLLVIIVFMLSFIAIIFAIGYTEMNAMNDIKDGPPTYEGNVTKVTFKQGGFSSNDITIITLDNGQTFVVNDFDNRIVIGHYYKFWVRDTGKLLKLEEVV